MNSDELGAAELRGHVVMVDFWTFTCINWIRTAPYQRAWSRAYREDGLIVVGVHTPEFTFEHDLDGVRRAIRERDIDYPVVVDNDYGIWQAFDNHYWPARYVLDREGKLRHHHFGEGSYATTEGILQELLGIDRDHVHVAAHGVEAEADWAHLRTPETYLGSARSTGQVSGAGSAHDGGGDVSDLLPLNSWALVGQWTIGRERVVHGGRDGQIVLHFHARDAHLVMSRTTPEPIPFRVLLDGQVPGTSHGEDVNEDGEGLLGDGRMYHLYRASGKVRDRVVEITFEAPGAEAYAFTFG